ncbi:MAG TPA: molybdopterin-dependent oxidoreductase, partial [Flavisolibacter sp.]|nr:molybdopterin-dependent oxidoreductase [Flavisolibacter sp.]
IISFSIFFLCFGIGYMAWYHLYHQPETAGETQPTLRKGLEINEKIFSSLHSNNRLAKTYKKSDAVKNVRPNGDIGMTSPFDAATWKLQVVRGKGDTLRLTLADLKALPKTEVIFNFKCIEGWSQVTWWGGVRFSDFLRKYHLDSLSASQYAGLITPDNEYYVGIDMASMMHPQTILCYELNGKPLPDIEGYPLRLIIPVKYGIKNLKRIGSIWFNNEKPRDYWAERGYDYYAGL